VTQASLVAPWSTIEIEPPLLDEERVRDQLSAAEELHYVGHAGPALIAAGAALAGVLRIRGSVLAGQLASAGALLEALLANGVVSNPEHELLYRLLRAHMRLTAGYAPDVDASLSPCETAEALAVMVQLLEGPYGPPCGI
jgi:hypothetical protein